MSLLWDEDENKTMNSERRTVSRVHEFCKKIVKHEASNETVPV